jgi:hypothetical protein
VTKKYNLLLSPHPDDLVFSAFSILSKQENNFALVFFNFSNFTRWPIRSAKLVSGLRTFEDKAILSTLKAKVRYLFSEDDSVKVPEGTAGLKSWDIKIDFPHKIFSPLGVGGSPNHLQVRNWAIKRWNDWNKKCELIFYEDLPYAAKIENSKQAESQIINELQRSCGRIEENLETLSASQVADKIRMCKAYFSQTDYSEIIGKYARIQGRSTLTGFAEMFYRVL